MIAGGFKTICENLSLLSAIRHDQDAIKAFVEEAARLHSPSKITMRTEAQDIELCNRQFRAGDWIAMAWASGNRDEALFPIQTCSASIASPTSSSLTATAHMLWRTFGPAENAPAVRGDRPARDPAELADEPKCIASLMVSGLKSLPVRYCLR
ncbi:cytochrome P450-terp [Sphingobium sp. MI1205]|nr:cytochrome P450-terp [Sphingobium sp. MI1205]